MSKRSLRKVRHYKAAHSFKDLTHLGVFRAKLARGEMTLEQVPEKYQDMFKAAATEVMSLHKSENIIDVELEPHVIDKLARIANAQTDEDAVALAIEEEPHVHGEHCHHE